MTDKTRNLIIRTASGAVLLAVVLAAVLISRWGYAALVALIAVGGVSELLSMAQKAGISPQKWTAGALSLLLVATTVLLSEGVTRSPRAIALGLVLAAVAIVLIGASFIIELFRKSDTPIQNLAVTHLGTVYVALPMALAYLIPMVSDVSASGWNPSAALAYIFIVWANDVFAYLTGITFGRHRLCERLSPKKSWEGFFGGIIGAVATGALAALYMNADVTLWCIVGAVAALSGVGGDLAESMFKRSVGIKDSGRILPGHGGFLDRFDAMLLSAPLVFLIFVIYASL